MHRVRGLLKEINKNTHTLLSLSRLTWADVLNASACCCAKASALTKRHWRWLGTLATATMPALLTHTGHSLALVWQAEHARWPHVVRMETWGSKTAKHTSQ